MSNLYKENKDILVSCSPFAIYPNEEIVSEIRKSDFKFSWIKPDEIKGKDVELIFSIYTLQYSTSRQLTQYLNIIRGIDIPQREITRLLTNYNKKLISSRFSFISDLSNGETNLKAYALAKNGSIILKSRPFNCTWKHTDSSILEDIKRCLARNQLLLKFAEELGITLIEWKSSVIGVNGYFSYENIKYHILVIRRDFDYINKFSNSLNNLLFNSAYNTSDKIVILGEDDKHVYEVFKYLVVNKLLNNNILFTQDNRLITSMLDNCFIKFNIYKSDGKTKIELTTCSFK